MTSGDCTADLLEPFVRLSLDCVCRPYPYHLVHVVNSNADVKLPRKLNPAFYGCFDWHSAVHGHWTLVRAIRLFPHAPWADDVRAVLSQNLTERNLQAEADYFRAPDREGFERPYGLAWLLQLSAELREFRVDFDARNWSRWLAPLESIAVERLASWLPKLTHPIRSGEHSQTAFAMGLALDWARSVRDSTFESLLVARAIDFYLNDTGAPLRYEPSGHDFLSPALAEADLMRRVLPADQFAPWLLTFLPDGQLAPVRSSDPADGKLSHLDGLNLSRGWMLEGIAQALPDHDPRRASLLASALAHADAGIVAIQAVHYAGAHWLGSFAVYLLTGRGMGA